jgi:hypothetical protein
MRLPTVLMRRMVPGFRRRLARFIDAAAVSFEVALPFPGKGLSRQSGAALFFEVAEATRSRGVSLLCWWAGDRERLITR